MDYIFYVVVIIIDYLKNFNCNHNLIIFPPAVNNVIGYNYFNGNHNCNRNVVEMKIRLLQISRCVYWSFQKSCM